MELFFWFLFLFSDFFRNILRKLQITYYHPHINYSTSSLRNNESRNSKKLSPRLSKLTNTCEWLENYQTTIFLTEKTIAEQKIAIFKFRKRQTPEKWGVIYSSYVIFCRPRVLVFCEP